MPIRRVAPLALAAWLSTALLAAACGPGDPPSPGPEDAGSAGGGDTAGGGDAGGGDPGAGGDASGGDASGGAGEPGAGGGTDTGGSPGAGAGGGGTGGGGGAGGGGTGGGDGGIATAWAIRSGGAGDEWVQDVAAAPGGAVVALTVIGPRAGGGFDQLGILRLGPGGGEQLGRVYDVRARVQFPADGALSVGPGGEIYVALAAQCGSGCGALGGAVNGSALVQLSASGDPRWLAALPGDVASQPVVDPQGNVAVASASGGANVVRSYSPGGAVRWEVSLPGATGDVALASDGGSNILVGRGSEVTKLAPGGAVAWSRSVGAQIAGVAGTGSGAVVVAGTASQGPLVLVLESDGDDGPVQGLPGGGGVLVEVGAGRRIGAVSGAPGCGSTITALDLEGNVLGSRPVAAAECDGSDLAAHAVTVTTQGAVVVGGALRGSVDLGRGRVTPARTDGFVASFGP